jgi:hypothetical protein
MVGHEMPEQKSIFSVYQERSDPIYDDPLMLSRVLFMVNKDKKMINRQVYTFFDWLGDWGGLRDALLMLGSWILPILRQHTLSKFLTYNLFTKQSDLDADDIRNLSRKDESVKLSITKRVLKSRQKVKVS